MSTPTPMKTVLSQQGRTPSQSQTQQQFGGTPPVSTPFSASAVHTAFSPLGPRSSPQNVKKSPANSATLMGYYAGGGPPMNYDSPAAAAMGAALSINGGSGGGDGPAANPAMLGGGGMRIGGSDEDERARRLGMVVAMLRAHSKGRVSEAGLERLATSMGLECLWEEGMGGGGGGGSKPAQRTLIIAGLALAVEIVVSNNIVESVAVTFPESRHIVLRHVERANQILLDDLKLAAHESPLTKSLDCFAADLEQLAMLDRLSVEPGVGAGGLNLYEAVAGIYETLDRLYMWDLQQVRTSLPRPSDDHAAAMAVQCTRHGRPTMHEDGHLGLAQAYWSQRRLVPPTMPSTKQYAASRETTWRICVGCVPVGSLVYQPVRVSDKWLSDSIVKLDGGHMLLGADHAPQPAEILEWLEPENTILPSTGDDKASGNGTAGGAGGGAGATNASVSIPGAKLPAVMFQAVFRPAVAVPFNVWHRFHEVIGLVPEHETTLVTYDALLFPVASGTAHDPSEPRTVRCDRDVYVRPPHSHESGNAASADHHHLDLKKHRNTLFIYKPVYGRFVTELPFSHPRQLIAMLPTLRQYAFLATVLEHSFASKKIAETAPAAAAALAPTARRSTAHAATTATCTGKKRLKTSPSTTTVATITLVDELEAFTDRPATGRATGGPGNRMDVDGDEADDRDSSRRSDNDADNDSDNDSDRYMDVVLTAHPAPRLQVVFPLRGRTADIVLEIEENAHVRVISQNVFADDSDFDTGTDGADNDNKGNGRRSSTGRNGGAKGKGKRLEPQDLARMLEVCEDLGIWCEWIRSRCA